MLLMVGEVRRLRIEQPPLEAEMTPAWMAEEQMKELEWKNRGNQRGRG